MPARAKIIDAFHKYWLVALFIGYLLFIFSAKLLPHNVVVILRVLLAVGSYIICLSLCRLCVNGVRRIRDRNEKLIITLIGSTAAIGVAMIAAPLAYLTDSQAAGIVALVAGGLALVILTIHSLLVLRSSGKLLKETQLRLDARKVAEKS